MSLFTENDWPLTADEIAALCGVSNRTARRWLAGHSKPKKAARDLIQLHQAGRIMPRKWPQGWRFTGDRLDTGHPEALSWQQIDWYFYSVHCWYKLLDLIPRIEARIDALMAQAPKAQVIDLQRYRDELQRLKERPFSLPPHLVAYYYELPEKEAHRKTGC